MPQPREGSLSESGGGLSLLRLVAPQFGLDLRDSSRGFRMPLLCSEPIIRQGLLEVLHAPEPARFECLTDAVGSIGISVVGFL